MKYATGDEPMHSIDSSLTTSFLESGLAMNEDAAQGGEIIWAHQLGHRLPLQWRLVVLSRQLRRHL